MNLRQELVDAGFVKRKFFGLIKTKELDPKLDAIIGKHDFDDNIVKLLFQLSKDHFHLEYKNYVKGGGMLSIEQDGNISVHEVNDNDIQTSFKSIVAKLVDDIESRTSHHSYLGL